jgi:PKD repeat protein
MCGGVMGTPLGTAPNGAKYNQLINGHFYWYQEEWSNQGHTCLQRLTPASVQPTAQFTATAGGGLKMAFDATGSTAPGGVADYVWQFNDSFGAQTVEQTTPTITHTFPAAGAYSIGLTIYAHTGLSTGMGAIVTTGRNGFSRGFTFSPAAPAHGQTVTFSALTKVSNQPVINYLWEFGDGSTGSGAKPQHKYATAGTYTVTLVLFSGTGSAFPGQGAGPIVTAKIIVS